MQNGSIAGQATVDGIRLRCRGHNQYEAERTFGVREALAFLGRARFARSTSSEAPGKRPEPPLLHYTPNSSGSQARPSSLGGPM